MRKGEESSESQIERSVGTMPKFQAGALHSNAVNKSEAHGRKRAKMTRLSIKSSLAPTWLISPLLLKKAADRSEEKELFSHTAETSEHLLCCWRDLRSAVEAPLKHSSLHHTRPPPLRG